MNSKLQLVYVLVSSEKDIYLEQAYVSMYSAKYHMPDVTVTLVVDELTNASFVGKRKEEVKYADNIVVVKIPGDLNAQKRSRVLKTSVREHVKGDFLFIDTDTIVAKPLYEIMETDADIAACHDTHCPVLKENPFYEKIVNRGKTLEWPIEKEEHYINTGVIFVRDSELAHKFYKVWNETLIEGWKKGVTMDQPSFAKTNYLLGHVVKYLGDVWNCELKYGIRWLKDAKIVHYLCSNKSMNEYRQFFIMNDQSILLQIKATGGIPNDVVETVKDPFYGIAPVSHCFAGEDIYFFTTPLCNFIRGEYGKKSFDVITKILFKYQSARCKLGKIKRWILHEKRQGM